MLWRARKSCASLLTKAQHLPVRNKSHKSTSRRTMKIAVEGCCHGELDAIYKHIAVLEQRNNYKVDCLVICGDFQAVRNHQDLECMSVPNKYKQLGGFHRYYTGKAVAPILTLVIGGNHEASNYMWELYHGGWLAPNIYFIGFAGCVQVNGVRIAGASGIYSEHHYKLGHYEAIPYDHSAIRSIYHVREYDIFRLSLLSSPDIVVSHDWPLGVARYGNQEDLLRRKPFFRSEVQSNTLGSPPAMQLLQKLKPTWWFSAHLHCKFEATVVHGNASTKTEQPKGDNPDEIILDDLDDGTTPDSVGTMALHGAASPSVDQARELQGNPDEILLDEELDNVAVQLSVRHATRFLALDKCLPRRQFLEVVDVPTVESPTAPRFTFDPEWLAITRAFHPYLSTTRVQSRLPGTAEAKEMVERELDWVNRNIGSKAVSECQTFQPTAPGPGSEGPNRRGQPPWYTNRQTEALCYLLQVENKINPVPKGVQPESPSGATASNLTSTQPTETTGS